MKDRIAHIMRAKNLKASDFANLLGIQPSGISHILSGRNQPSLDFVKKIKETFPEYNLEWIIFGTGPITTSDPFQLHTPVSNQNPPMDFSPVEDTTNEIPEPNPPTFPQPAEQPAQLPSSTNAKVKSMLVLYDDGTFETFLPR